jgi:CheY-like chemotaxis protein
MPNLNGPDAIKKIREMDCKSLIVGVTGNVLAEDVAYFVSCGANCVLSKPVKFQRLEDIWLEHGFGDTEQTLDA